MIKNSETNFLTMSFFGAENFSHVQTCLWISPITESFFYFLVCKNGLAFMILPELLEQYELSQKSCTYVTFQSELLGTIWTKLIHKEIPPFPTP